MYFEFTTTGSTPAASETLNRFLEKNRSRHSGFDFELHNLEWNEAWPHMMRVSIDKTGSDLAEVGAPWVSDFVNMNSLRPFSRQEVEAVGGDKAFFHAAWKNIVMAPASAAPGGSPGAANAAAVYALPGRVDVRIIYYWKDMLEQAGIDPATAFTTPAQIEHTLETLRAKGKGPAAQTPWVYQTDGTRNQVYNMASWIWACGGDFVDERGLPIFDQTAAIDGMEAYFRLHRYLAPTQAAEPIETVFSQRRTAVMLAGTYYHIRLLHGEDTSVSKELQGRLGAAQLPGPAFVGGTSFVIWQHASYKAERAALDLLTQLQNSPQLAEYCYMSHMLPSRLDGFEHAKLAADPFLPVLRASLEAGRTHNSVRLWMFIADRLSGACRAISSELRADSGKEVRAVVERHMRPLAQRVRMGFGGTSP